MIDHVEHRNSVRRECGLPLLDVAEESVRLRQMKTDADFENFFAERRPELKHRWEVRGAGFLSRMALYQIVRQELRREFERTTGRIR